METSEQRGACVREMGEMDRLTASSALHSDVDPCRCRFRDLTVRDADQKEVRSRHGLDGEPPAVLIVVVPSAHLEFQHSPSNHD